MWITYSPKRMLSNIPTISHIQLKILRTVSTGKRQRSDKDYSGLKIFNHQLTRKETTKTLLSINSPLWTQKNCGTTQWRLLLIWNQVNHILYVHVQTMIYRRLMNWLIFISSFKTMIFLTNVNSIRGCMQKSMGTKLEVDHFQVQLLFSCTKISKVPFKKHYSNLSLDLQRVLLFQKDLWLCWAQRNPTCTQSFFN